MTTTISRQQKTTRPPRVPPVVRRFVQEAGNASQAFGFGRVVGQIYAFLYFTERPCNLGDLCSALGISKGSASMGVRQLEQWGAVRKIWIKGDRKDYYEALTGLGSIIRKALADVYAVKMDTASGMLEQALDEVDPENGDSQFVRDRLEHLETFRERARKAWDNPLMQRLLR